MKVLLVSGVYPPSIGGPSAQTHQLAQGLMHRGVEVRVVTFGDSPGHSSIEGIPITFLNGSQRCGWQEKITKNWQVFRQLCQIIQAFQPNVVHQQTATANLGLYTGLAARQCRVPNLIKYSSDLRWERSQQHKIVREENGATTPTQTLSIIGLTGLQKLLFTLFDRIWVTTPPFQVQLQQDFQVALKKILLLPNFIDLSTYLAVAEARERSADPPGSSEMFEILVVSRLKPWKGVDICIQALAELRELPIKLRIVGQGTSDYEAYLHNLVEILQLSHQVEFVGQISPQFVHQQYLKADLFILASQYEPFGIVLVEAMAAGVPIVASQVGGIPSVVDDAAVMVPPNDVQALAQSIRALVTDRKKQASLIAKGKQRSRMFALDKGIDRLMEEYHRLAH